MPPSLQVRAGTGGEEAALWAADLIRMYQKYADSQVGLLTCWLAAAAACFLSGAGWPASAIAVGHCPAHCAVWFAFLHLLASADRLGTERADQWWQGW